MKKQSFIGFLISVLFVLFSSIAGIAQQSNAGILFLNFHVSRVQNDERQIELASYRVVQGELKGGRAESQHVVATSKIRCIISDADGKSLYETEVADPLMREYEYGDENGNLEHASVASDAGDFSLRLPHNTAYSRIRLESISEERTVSVQSLTLNLK